MRYPRQPSAKTHSGENPTPGRYAEEEDEAGASKAVRSQAEPVNEEKASTHTHEFAQNEIELIFLVGDNGSRIYNDLRGVLRSRLLDCIGLHLVEIKHL